MVRPTRFSYTTFADEQGTALIRPLIPIQLTHTAQSITADALLDSGADVNVLPYRLGHQLGLNWEEARPMGTVSGNLSRTQTRAVILDTRVEPFPLVRLLFIWVNTDAARLLLGQLNFFQKFNVCFFGFDNVFEISPRD